MFYQFYPSVLGSPFFRLVRSYRCQLSYPIGFEALGVHLILCSEYLHYCVCPCLGELHIIINASNIIGVSYDKYFKVGVSCEEIFLYSDVLLTFKSIEVLFFHFSTRFLIVKVFGYSSISKEG